MQDLRGEEENLFIIGMCSLQHVEYSTPAIGYRYPILKVSRSFGVTTLDNCRLANEQR